MLTNPRDAFRRQSKSPDMITFDMVGMVSYWCSIVTLSVLRLYLSGVLRYSTCNLETRVKGRSRSSEPTHIDPPIWHSINVPK